VRFLLDTNAISEWIKPRPDPGLIAWMASVDEDRTFVSVISLAELRYGIERLPESNRRRNLETWLNERLTLRFEGRILWVDALVAEMWGRLTSRNEFDGRPKGIMDTFLAATAAVHELTIVSRNVEDFPAAKVLNPWSG
jgi:predicted nucleic acid-binding protein